MSIGKEWRWILSEAKHLAWLYIVQVLLVLLATAATLADPWILKRAIDQAIVGGEPHRLLYLAPLFLATISFRIALVGASGVLGTFTTHRLATRIRFRLTRHLQTLGRSFYRETPIGDLVHRFDRDVEVVAQMGSQQLALLVRSVLSSVLTLALMFFLSWKLTLVAIVTLPLAVFGRHRYGRRLLGLAKESQASRASLLARFQDHLANMLEVQLLGQERSERKELGSRLRQLAGAEVRHRKREELFVGSSFLLVATSIALALGYGGYQVTRGVLSIGGLVAFFTYLDRLFGPVETVISSYARLQRSRASLGRLWGILAEQPEVRDAGPRRTSPRRHPAELRVEGVAFGYEPGSPVLTEVGFTARAGDWIAFTGRSGSGKSTLALLLARCIDPSRGTIFFNDTDIRKIGLPELRKNIALVPQHGGVFDGTFRENVCYGKKSAGRFAMKGAVRVAQLESVFTSLPGGWEEPLGSRGSRLSGGEKQRLAIARALLREPSVLILDEATAALDGETEMALLCALREEYPKLLVILIAHREATIGFADRVFHLAGGRLSTVPNQVREPLGSLQAAEG